MDNEVNPVIGIDFGTTCARIARWNGFEAVPYSLSGNYHMSSVACFDPRLGEMLFGQLALARGAMTPEQVVINIKRHLGEGGYSASLGGKIMSPTEIVSNILVQLLSSVQTMYPAGVWQPAGAVITHPYCFKYPQIAALREAAQMAGIKVLRLVPDTVVMPLVYSFNLNHIKVNNIVVFDLGGGTLDITVLHVACDGQRQSIEVISTGGDDHLGGIDFDEAFVNLIIERMNLKLNDYDYAIRLRALAKLRDAVNMAKLELSVRNDAFLVIADVVPGRNVDLIITRADFETVCASHLQKIREITADTITRAGLSAQDINKVFITGEASRMPAVMKIVEGVTGSVSIMMDPVSSVACGAAVLAAVEASRLDGDGIIFDLVTPYAVGLRTVDGKLSPLIKEHSRLPCEVTRDEMVTAPGAVIQLDVFQGTCDTNTQIGTVTVEAPQVDTGSARVTLAVDTQQMVSFKVERDSEITQGLLPTPGLFSAGASEEAQHQFCPEARELVEEMERATEILPCPMASVATRVIRKAHAGKPPVISDIMDLLHDWLCFAVDCLLADYLMSERHDIPMLQLLAERTTDDSEIKRIAITERLITLAKLGHVAVEAPVLVDVTRILLNEMRRINGETHALATEGVALRRELNDTECRRLTELTKTALCAIDGFILYAGYGDSVYRFQGTTPSQATSSDIPVMRHGSCVFVNRETHQELRLDSLWEIGVGPILHRRELACDMPVPHAWTIDNSHVVLVDTSLQELIVDVIVVTNDTNLGMRTITAASVARAAGEEFLQQIQDKSMEFGDVLATSAGRLAAKEVYHACTMGGSSQLYGSDLPTLIDKALRVVASATRQLTGDDLLSLIGKALQMAANAGYTSIAFPLVGTNYGIEATEIASNYIRAFCEHAQRDPMPSLIVLCTPQVNDPVASAVISELDTYEEKAAYASRKARVFISVNHADYQYASQVYRFLRSRGVSTFFCEESLPQLGSSDYRREIDRALDNAEHIIVIASSVEHVQSPWVEAEWGLFINEKRSGRKSGNIITLAVGSLQPSDLPPSLRYYEVIAFDPEQFPKLCQYVTG